jgi:hypothetical protein
MIQKFILLSLFYSMVFSVDINFKIEANDMSENMKDFVLGKALSAISQSMTYNQIAEKIVSGLKEEFGSKWICLIGPLGLVSHFEAMSGSTLWFSNGNTQIIVFKPLPEPQSFYIFDARKSNPKITIINNEMTEVMKDMAISMSEIAINAYNDFHTISANISVSFQKLYGNQWNCFVTTSGINYTTNYVPNTFISFEVEEIFIILY